MKKTFFLKLLSLTFFSLCFSTETLISRNSTMHSTELQKTIGILGGVSFESTLLYYKLINESVREQLKGLRSAKLLLYNFDYETIVELENQGRWEEVGNLLGKAAFTLQEAGADFVILACNTLHKVAPSIEAAITIPFLHIADAAGNVLKDSYVTKIGLLGTKVTMEEDFYTKRLNEKFQLDVLTPSLEDRTLLDQIIYEELCLGKNCSTSKKEILRMIKELEQKGAEAILLACTELGMLIQKEDVKIPVYDTTVLHTKNAVKTSLFPMEIVK